jgi:hypothetical protein
MSYLHKVERPLGYQNKQFWEEWDTKKAEMCKWCTARGMTHWGTSDNVFWFTHEKDYMMFLLRWQ